MYEIRQLEIPSSFMALYCVNGRAVMAREFVEARYEACEDLAQHVSELCANLSCKEELADAVVLQRCHAGLLQTPETVSALEAAWVTCRAAELLQWDHPTHLLEAPEPA
jgi:hypothetical protein